jgi:hypothetical protein
MSAPLSRQTRANGNGDCAVTAATALRPPPPRVIAFTPGGQMQRAPPTWPP